MTPHLHENETLHEVNEHVKLIQRVDGLTFGTDAYLLAAFVRPQKSAVAVDLGSGTGIIPLLCLARDKASRFTAVEIQPTFCDLIERNAVLNGMAAEEFGHGMTVSEMKQVAALYLFLRKDIKRRIALPERMKLRYIKRKI